MGVAGEDSCGRQEGTKEDAKEERWVGVSEYEASC